MSPVGHRQIAADTIMDAAKHRCITPRVVLMCDTMGLMMHAYFTVGQPRKRYPSILYSRLTGNGMNFFKHIQPFLLLSAALLSACGESAVDTPEVESGPAYNLSLNMTDFMNKILEPSADGLWRSAGWVLDEVDGYYELYPTDDEGWQQVENHAAMVVEAGNAMLLPGRAMPEGEWTTYTEAMSTVGLTAMQAARDQDKEAVFQAGAQLYSVCTACHQAYNPEILSRFVPGSLDD